MRVKITLNYPKAEILKLVEFASIGINDRNITLAIKNSRYAFRGRAYHGIWWLNGKKHKNYCVIAIGKETHFPIKSHKYPRLRTAPTYDLNDWREALIICTAHELHHQKKFRTRKRNSEVDAERWAVKRLEAYRQQV